MSAPEQPSTSAQNRPLPKLGRRTDYSYLHVMPDKLARLQNFSKVCRICSAITDKLHNLFEKDGLKTDLVDKINKYLPIKVEKNDHLPQSICTQCCEALLAWDELGKQARIADIVMRRRLRTMQPAQHPVEPPPSADAGKISKDGKFVDAATDPRPRCPERICSYCPLTLPAREYNAHIVADHSHLVFRCQECHSYLDKQDLVFHMARHSLEADSDVDSVKRETLLQDEEWRRELLAAFKRKVDEVLGSDDDDEDEEMGELAENGLKKEEKGEIKKPPPGDQSDDDDILSFLRKDQNESIVDLEIARMADSIKSIEDIHRVIKEVEQLARKLTEHRLAQANGHIKQEVESRADTAAEKAQPTSKELPAAKRPKRAKKEVGRSGKQKEAAENASEPASPARAELDEREHDGDDEAEPPRAKPRRKPADKSPKAARTCPICGKEYRASSSYFYHMKYFHKRSREHECEACGKKFGTRANLAEHSSIHTGACELACKECGKRFRSKASRYIHEQSHGGVKRYSCGQCARSFRWRTHLARHAQRHAAARAHVCGACGRGFSVRCDLLRHALTHAADEFHCEQCGLKFAQKRYLKVHVLKKHAAPPAPAARS